MFDDWDPRDSDARDGDDSIRDREEEWLVLGRGPGSAALRDDTVEHDTRDREEDWRDDRDSDARDREDERGGVDPRDVFMRDLDLPRGRERELVHDRDRDYTLNGSDTRTLSTVGAFRVVPERDLRDPRDAAFDVRERDLRHLENQELIQRVPLDGHDRAVSLTDRGCGLLERHRDRDSREYQAFYSGADKARERTHDAQLYRAYLKAADRLREREARILRVELDRELKREYQPFCRTAIGVIATAMGVLIEAAKKSKRGRPKDGRELPLGTPSGGVYLRPDGFKGSQAVAVVECARWGG